MLNQKTTAEEVLSITEAVPMENSSTPYWSKQNVLKYMQEYASLQTAAKQKEIDLLKEENTEYRQRVDENVKSIESMLHHNEALQKHFDIIKSTNQSYLEENTDLKKQLGIEETQNELLVDECNELKESRENILNNFTELQIQNGIIKAEISEIKSNRKNDIEQAHMAGQRNSTIQFELPNGIDPSYSEANNYYESLNK